MSEFKRRRDNRITFNTKDELIEALENYDPEDIEDTDPEHISNWDVSQITDMSELFSVIEDFNEDISNWDVSNVWNMSGMFTGCSKFNQPLENWDVSKVTNMDGMFAGCTEFNQPLENWDVSNVENMEGMFYICSKFNQPLEYWDVSKVTNMTRMFFKCTEFNQPLENWIVSNVTNMSYMFYYCDKFNQKLNSWTIIHTDNWNVNNVTNMSYMFCGCTEFNQPLENWDVRNVENMSGMFSQCTHFNQDLSDWNVSKVQNMSYMFEDCTSFNSNLSRWDVSKVTTMGSMFKRCLAFNQELNSWGPHLSNVTTMEKMFAGCLIFNQPLNSWGPNLGNVTNMSGMFGECTRFNQPLNSWGPYLSNVTNMTAMFYECTSFNQPLDSWGPYLINVTAMDGMFYDCASFNQDLSGWTTNQQVSAIRIFHGTSMPEEYIPDQLRDTPPPRTEGRAYEIHEYFKSLNRKEIYNILTEFINDTNHSINPHAVGSNNINQQTNELTPLENFIDSKFNEEDKPNYKNILKTVKGLIDSFYSKKNSPLYNTPEFVALVNELEKLVNASIAFVIRQDDEFIDEYIRILTDECAKAYKGSTIEESCDKGAVEKIITGIGNIAYNRCLDDTTCTELMSKLKTVFKKMALTDSRNEWIKHNITNGKLKEKTENERRTHFINYLTTITHPMNDAIRGQINKLADTPFMREIFEKGKLSEETCNNISKHLNDHFLDWIEKYIDDDSLKNMDPNVRREHFIKYVRDLCGEGRDEAEIRNYAYQEKDEKGNEAYTNTVFRTFQMGGKPRRKTRKTRKTRRFSKSRVMTKKRRTRRRR